MSFFWINKQMDNKERMELSCSESKEALPWWCGTGSSVPLWPPISSTAALHHHPAPSFSPDLDSSGMERIHGHCDTSVSWGRQGRGGSLPTLLVHRKPMPPATVFQECLSYPWKLETSTHLLTNRELCQQPHNLQILIALICSEAGFPLEPGVEGN